MSERVIHVAVMDGKLMRASLHDEPLADLANRTIEHLEEVEFGNVTKSVTRTLDGWLREVEARVVDWHEGVEHHWVHTFKYADDHWCTHDGHDIPPTPTRAPEEAE